MTLQELLVIYDSPEKKGFYNHDLTGDLKSLPEEERIKPEYSYEGIIHSLQIHPEGCHWGTYLGFMVAGKNPDGTPFEFPSQSDVTQDVVSYSLTRMRQTKNPRMQMQYASVCWDFMISKPSDLHETYVDSLLLTINGDYEPHPVITAKHIRRVLSISGKNSQHLDKIKKAIRDFTQRHGGDDKAAGIWGVEFDVMIGNKKLFTTSEINALVSEHESRLARLIADDSKLDPFAVQEQVTLLADYYKSETTPDNKLRVLMILEDSFRKSGKNKPALYRMGTMQMMHNIYNTYNLPNEAKRLLPEIQQIASEAPSEMEMKQVEYTPSKEEDERLQAFIDEHFTGSDSDKFSKYIYYHIEKKDNLVEQVKHNAEIYPLWAMTPTQMMDEKGRPMSILRSVDDDLDGHTAYAASQNMLFTANIFHQITQKHISDGFFNVSNILNEVKQSAIIDASRYEIIEHALEFFFAEDYVTFCHLIVPQIEDALRNLVEKNGNSVIKRQKNGFGFQLKTLDDLLVDPSLVSILTNDGVFHLRTLLTDQKGLNIRNLLCHGISNPKCFNAVAAERLLHALLMLSMIRYI